MTAQTTAYLRALVAGEAPCRYVEVRYRRPGGMGQLFFAAGQLEDAARVIHGLGSRTDVYVGVIPRTFPAGDRSAVVSGQVLWADCDDHASSARLASFQPAPSFMVRSGSPGACHAYWILARALPVAGIEHLNQRLAATLAADPHAIDAVRVLRPPGTLNFKRSPPVPVELVRQIGDTVDPRRLEHALPELPRKSVSRHARDRAREDVLLHITPAEYICALLGVDIDRARKIRCPFHEDRTPSLHVYDEPERGWHCFGCGRGGSIYDFAGHLWKLDTRGEDFLTLRSKLRRTFGE